MGWLTRNGLNMCRKNLSSSSYTQSSGEIRLITTSGSCPGLMKGTKWFLPCVVYRVSCVIQPVTDISIMVDLFCSTCQMPETTWVAFISRYFPHYPVFVDMPDHILSFLKCIIHCLPAWKSNRFYLLYVCMLVSHLTVSNQNYNKYSVEYLCYTFMKLLIVKGTKNWC